MHKLPQTVKLKKDVFHLSKGSVFPVMGAIAYTDEKIEIDHGYIDLFEDNEVGSCTIFLDFCFNHPELFEVTWA